MVFTKVQNSNSFWRHSSLKEHSHPYRSDP